MTQPDSWRSKLEQYGLNRKTLFLLTVCVGMLLVVLLIAAVLVGGLDDTLRARTESELNNFASARQQFASTHKQVEKTLSDHSELFPSTGLSQTWRERLDRAAEQVKVAGNQEQKLRSRLDENDAATKAEVEQLIQTLAATRIRVLAQAKEIQEAAQQVVDFPEDADKRLDTLQANYHSIQRIDFSGLESQVEQAALDWPDKKTDLHQRLERYTNQKAEADRTWQSTEAIRHQASEGQFTGSAINRLLEVGNRFREIRAELSQADTQLPALIDQLYWSWDKILVDMDLQEGTGITFRQKFKTIRIRALVPDGEKVETKTNEEWQVVSESNYKSLKDKLGMVVEHKPAGKYDHESTKMVQPPGYAYISHPNQQRNHYGYWDRSSGFWRWYGQYALFRDLMGGTTYGRVNRGQYHNYENARNFGRPYYGRDRFGRKVYGSGGLATKTTYASSKYVRTDGFRNSRYARSGGTYRGSRYSGRSNRSYRSSSASRSGGSRFSFGGK